MPNLKIAHINQQGVDLIIVPLDPSFENMAQDQQLAAISEIQSHASGAGLRGTVVPVWPSGGWMRFIAPQPWHPFFQNITLDWVEMNLNRELSW